MSVVIALQMIVFEEGGTILKVGQDAVTLAVVDLWWTDDGELHSAYKLLPTSMFEEDPAVAALKCQGVYPSPIVTTDCFSDPLRALMGCDIGQCMLGEEEGGHAIQRAVSEHLQPRRGHVVQICQTK
eukprot:scaffold341071_cov29-Prasinocladus_malaysianus.AAC.1